MSSCSATLSNASAASAPRPEKRISTRPAGTPCSSKCPESSTADERFVPVTVTVIPVAIVLNGADAAPLTPTTVPAIDAPVVEAGDVADVTLAVVDGPVTLFPPHAAVVSAAIANAPATQRLGIRIAVLANGVTFTVSRSVSRRLRRGRQACGDPPQQRCHGLTRFGIP